MKRLTEHFFEHEFLCKCARPECDAVPMLKGFLSKLQALRMLWDRPLVPTSGRRCSYHNSRIPNAAPKSQHLLGNAADFVFSRASTLEEFVILAEKIGFKGIGIGRRKVHLDDRKSFARWTY